MRETRHVDTRVVGKLQLTSRTQFGALVDVVEIPDPSIVASMPTNCLTKSGRLVVADADR